MKLCRAAQLHMLVLEIVSHGDMKMCRMILFIKGKQRNCVAHLYYLLNLVKKVLKKIKFYILIKIKGKPELVIS